MVIRDLTWKNLAAARASSEALRSSSGDGSVCADVAAKKVPKHIGAACGWWRGLKGLVVKERCGHSVTGESTEGEREVTANDRESAEVTNTENKIPGWRDV